MDHRNFDLELCGGLRMVRKGKWYKIGDRVHEADIIAPSCTEALAEWRRQRELLQRDQPVCRKVAKGADRGRAYPAGTGR